MNPNANRPFDRRNFLQSCGLGLGGLALADLFQPNSHNSNLMAADGILDIKQPHLHLRQNG